MRPLMVTNGTGTGRLVMAEYVEVDAIRRDAAVVLETINTMQAVYQCSPGEMQMVMVLRLRLDKSCYIIDR